MKPLPSVDAGHTGAPDMSAGFGSWLFGASALGMLGMASSIFIVLAATTFGSALLYAMSGFGFAVLAAPPFLLFLDPARAIQLVIIISTVLSIVVLRGLFPAIAPWLLLRLALGSLAGLPLGLVAFRYADPIVVRAAAGAMIFGFAILMAISRRRSGQPGRGKHWRAFAMSPRLDPRRRGRVGHRERSGGSARPAGADLPAACRGGAEDRARDAPCVLRAHLWSDARFPCGDDRHSWPDLACCGHPAPLCLLRRPRRPSDR